MNPHRLLNEVGANYSAYRTRNFVGVLTRHLIEHNKYASWTLLLGLWAPGMKHGKIIYTLLENAALFCYVHVSPSERSRCCQRNL